MTITDSDFIGNKSIEWVSTINLQSIGDEPVII